jgi:NADH-quinone oxidoreductase subunit M
MDKLIDLAFSPTMLSTLLLVVVFGPLVYAALMLLLRNRQSGLRRVAGLLSGLHLVLTVLLVAPAAVYLDEYAKVAGRPLFSITAVPGDVGTPQKTGDVAIQSHETNWNLFLVAKQQPGMPVPAVQLLMGIDGINIWLVLLSSLMCYVAVLCSYRMPQEKAAGYFAWLYVLQTFLTATFVSFDILVFYIFFELTLLPSFFLIGSWGVGSAKRDAARKFFLYTLLGGLFTLVGIIGLVYTNPNTPKKLDGVDLQPDNNDINRGTVSFNINKLLMHTTFRRHAYEDWVANSTTALQGKAWEKNQGTKKESWKQADYEADVTKATEACKAYLSSQTWIFFALIAGFVVKIPLIPFHTWLPSAYAEAPPAITMLMSALMAKLGTLGLLRIVIPLCPDAAVQYGLPVFGTLGAIGVVYASCCAFAQRDLKLLAAYSSVAHLGLLVLGMFALNTEGLTGAAMHMVNHGLTAGLMFAVVCFLADRYRTTDMTLFGGLMKQYPKFAFFTIVTSLASVGLPGLSSFVSEMLLLSGLFTPWNASLFGYGLAIAGASGIFLSAWYTFTMIRRVFFGPVKEPLPVADGPKLTDFTRREALAFLLPTIAIVVLGVYPQPFLNVMRADIGVIEMRMRDARHRLNPSLAERESPQQKEDQNDAPMVAPKLEMMKMGALPKAGGGMQKGGVALPKGATPNSK